jgi:hypothetical protein
LPIVFERLDDSPVGHRALDAFAERVLAANRELGGEACREVERVHGVDHDLAREVVRAGLGDRLLGCIAEDRQHDQLAVRRGVGERST